MVWAVVASSLVSTGGVGLAHDRGSDDRGLHFDPDDLAVRAGETIRFVINDPTAIDQEFVLPAGETRELIHTVGAVGDLQIGRHVAGHDEAGMHADVMGMP
jgi:uncharacterized cupredoxin-like copper-binding protein